MTKYIKWWSKFLKVKILDFRNFGYSKKNVYHYNFDIQGNMKNAGPYCQNLLRNDQNEFKGDHFSDTECMCILTGESCVYMAVQRTHNNKENTNVGKNLELILDRIRLL